MSRKQARELVLQSLFHLDFNALEEAEAQETVLDTVLEAVVEEFEADLDNEQKKTQLTKKDRVFAKQLLEGTRNNLTEIDTVIGENSKDWKVQRMSGIDRNILRLAVYELKFSEEKLDFGIVINEAVELAKKYGTDDSGRFVNGVLGSLAKKQ